MVKEGETDRIADAITPRGAPARDATEGYVGSLTEAVMGMTTALVRIGNAIELVAEAIDSLAESVDHTGDEK